MFQCTQGRESEDTLHHQDKEKEWGEHGPDDGACRIVESGHDHNESLESQHFFGPRKGNDLWKKVVRVEHAEDHTVALREDVSGVGENEGGGPSERGEGEGGCDEVGEVECEAEDADGCW